LAASLYLEDSGFEVSEGADADDRIAQLQRHDLIHLVFLDIDMPGSMDGLTRSAGPGSMATKSASS